MMGYLLYDICLNTKPNVPLYLEQHNSRHGEPRTHEENSERSYIAASHRGDLPLSSRMVSAQKASEIHKRRTGKGLKITEEDVINEVMYKEEE